MAVELVEVVTTTAEKLEAQAIASMLVEKRLAACTQIVGPLESNYWWNDRMEAVREWKIIAKTRADLFGRIEQAIREVHSYDEPELLALPIVAIGAGYRQWLINQLAIPVKNGIPGDDIAAATEPREPQSSVSTAPGLKTTDKRRRKS